MPLPDLVAFINRIKAEAPEYDWKPTISEPAYLDRCLKPCAAPHELEEDGITLGQARVDMLEAMRRYAAEDYPTSMLLVRARPGTGKTQAAARLIDELIAAGHRVGYAGPRHDFFEDVVKKAADWTQWYEWLPRQEESEDKPETCRYTPQINKWLSRGYEAMDFCSGVCKWEYVKVCPYHVQKERTEPVIFIQHLHVTLGHPLKFSFLVGDESPISAFLKDWEIPARWVMPPGMDMTTPIAEILKQLADICHSTNRPLSGKVLYEGLGGPQSVLNALEGVEIPLDAIGAEEIWQANDADKKPYFHFPSLAALMRRECTAILENGDCVNRVIASPGALRLLLRRAGNKNLPAHIIWLDATGNPDIYAELFQRPVRVFDAAPEMMGKTYQVVDRANGKTAIKPRKKKETDEDAETLHAKQAKILIGEIIKQYGYKKPTVITYKGFDFGDLETDSGHFYASRGTNAHEDSDVVFVLGTPQPNIMEVVKAAKMIYFDRDKPFNTVWYANDMAYQYTAPDGLGRCYPISGFWNDLELNRVLQAFREDEITQAAHRGRPVNHQTDIWLLTNLPILSLPPDELLTMREIIAAPEGVNIWTWYPLKDLIESTPPGGTIGTQDIIRVTGCHPETATEYRKLIEKMDGWGTVKIVVAKKRGQPPKAARRNST